MILYLEDQKNFTRKFLELINEFSKAAGYKINTHKSNAFLFLSDESSEKLGKVAHSQYVQKIKYLGINLTKE